MGESGLAAIRSFAREHIDDVRVRALLERSHELPRVGSCTLEEPLVIDVPDARAVQVAWPAIGVDVDVVFLVHDGAVGAHIRDRIAAGPAAFLVVQSVSEIPTAWSLLDPDVLERARARSLWQGLASAGYDPPNLPICTAKGRAGVCVISPDEPDRVRVARGLEAADFHIVKGSEADIVVAVAPHRGWQRGDVAQLRHALSKVGRVVVTAPLPRGWCPEAVVAAESELVGAVRRRLAGPPVVPLPEINKGAWERCVARLDRHAPHAKGGLIDALVITILVFVGLLRMMPMGVAVFVAVLIGVLRLWARRHVIFSRSPEAGAWLRRKLAGAGGG